MSGALDITKQLAFYGSYHSNIANVLVHVACVPAIEFSTFGLGIMASKKLAEKFPMLAILQGAGVNAVSLYAAAIIPYYLLLGPLPAAVIRSSIVVGQYKMAQKLVSSGKEGLAKNLLLVKSIGWILQILAHKIFEGRAPALLDNLLQAVVLAPYFVLLEVLFFFGYNPELKKRYEALAKKQIEDWQKSVMNNQAKR